MGAPLKVALTHAEGRLEGLAEALAARGLEPVHAPLIGTQLLTAPGLVERARSLLTCDWLLFSSRSAVAAWRALELPLAGIRPNVGAVGDATARDLAALGGLVRLVGDPPNAEGLLERFLERVTPPAVVGLPCALRALPTLPDGLERAGFEVVRLPLYETVTRLWQGTDELMDAHIVVLASPSAAEALPQPVGASAQLVALGPSTQRALGARGWRAHQAPTPDVEGVVQAVLQAASLAPPQPSPIAPSLTERPV